MNDRVFLTLDERRKAIPYPSQTHEDSQNFGFKQLKGKSGKAKEIQEAKGFPGIVSVLEAINASDSPFFSIGCEKYIGPDQFGTHYARGYIEFAFNYANMVSFPQTADLFRAFSTFCSETGILEGATYNFQLQPAHFTKADTDGYSCCVWIRTGGHADQSAAASAYNNVVRKLGDFVSQYGPPASEPRRIY